MRASSWTLLVGAVVVCTAASTIGWRGHHVTLKAAINGEGPVATTELWFVFRPTDCTVDRLRFDTLNAIGAVGQAAVRGVMLEPPHDATAQAQLVKSFGAHFPIVVDTKGRWAAAVRAQGVVPPFYVVRGKTGNITVVPLVDLAPGTAVFEELVGAAANFEVAPGNAGGQAAPGRTFMAATVSREWAVQRAGALTLEQPSLIAVDHHAIAVYDYGLQDLVVFDDDGTVRSRYSTGGYGGSGAPSDMKFAGGDIVLLNPESQRVSWISPAGVIDKAVTIDHASERLIVRGNGTLAGFLPYTLGVEGYVFGPTGKTERIVSVASENAGVPVVARDYTIAALPGSDSAVIAYRYHSGLTLVSMSEGRERMVDGPEPVAFPKVISIEEQPGVTFSRRDPAAVTAATSVAADTCCIYTLFAGASQNAGRIIDVFDRGTARYVGSYLLPKRVDAIARLTDGFATVSLMPHGGGEVARWVVRSHVAGTSSTHPTSHPHSSGNHNEQ